MEVGTVALGREGQEDMVESGKWLYRQLKAACGPRRYSSVKHLEHDSETPQMPGFQHRLRQLENSTI
jgi:hypothetical protein